MIKESIQYSRGYKYQTKKDYRTRVAIWGYNVSSQFIMLNEAGTLFIRSGYAWDGPSGPAIDTKNFMRGSLVHDALYQLMREGLLDSEQSRAVADKELQRICLEDGMSRLRAWWVYKAVKLFGGPASWVETPIETAPFSGNI